MISGCCSADGFAQINSGVARREAIELDSGSGLTATSWSQAGRLDLRPPSFGPDWNPSGYDPSGPKVSVLPGPGPTWRTCQAGCQLGVVQTTAPCSGSRCFRSSLRT